MSIIPSDCKIPDLSDLNPIMGNALIFQCFHKSSLSHNAQLYRRIFMRLTDKAIREYQYARESIIKQLAEKNRTMEELQKGRIIYIIGFTDHIENCFDSTRRLYNLLKRLDKEKSLKNLPKELMDDLFVNNKYIRGIRNSIMHIDEHIYEGKVTPDQAIMIKIGKNDNNVIIENERIEFGELSTVLRGMYSVAQFLLTQ